MICPRCGASVVAGVAVCDSCGEPWPAGQGAGPDRSFAPAGSPPSYGRPPERSWTRILLVAVAVVAVLAVAGVAYLRFGGNGGDVPAVPSGGSTISASPGPVDPGPDEPDPGDTTPAGDGSDQTSEPDPGTSSPAADPEVIALAELETERQDSLASATVAGQWVAQLSSKTPGSTDAFETAANGTSTFYATDILEQFRSLRAQLGAPVYLFTTDDYSTTYTGPTLWVVFADPGLDSAAQVRKWCAGAFPGYSGDRLENACVPHRLRR